MLLTRFQEAASRTPDKVAILSREGATFRSHTYRDLLKVTASLCRGLADSGVRRGDRVAILSENRVEWICSYLATAGMGAVVVPLDAQLTSKEVALLLDNSGAKAVFVSASCREKLPSEPKRVLFSFDDACGLWYIALAGPGDTVLPPPPAPDDLAAILYTSGTTGDPKGVMLTHGNLASNCKAIIDLNIVTVDDNLLLILPLHHTYPAMACMILPLSLGGTVTILNSLKGPDIVSCMQEGGVSVLVGVPQLFAGLRRTIMEQIGLKPAPVRILAHALLRLNGALRSVAGLNLGRRLFPAVHAKFGPRLRLFASGGARLEPEVYTDLNRLGLTVIEAYGLTETSPASTFNPLERQKAGSIGIAIPGVDVRIVDPDAAGQGEIAVRGPNVMAGYFRKPEATAEVIRDGWFFTGDLGYRDKDGYFFITGRSKEMIVLSSGKKIFPDELERFYRQIPAIKEICLMQGERGLEAAVVPDFDLLRSQNIANIRETIAFAIEDLAKDLPPYKRIMGLRVFKDPLPVTRLGKLRRTKVREFYLAGGSSVTSTAEDPDAELLGSDTARKVVDCLRHFTDRDPIRSGDSLELDLGIDSLARVELVVSLERTFGTSLPDSFGSEVLTVRDVVQRLGEVLEAGPAAMPGAVRLSWADILRQEPSDDLKQSVLLEARPAVRAGQRAARALLRAFFLLYGRMSIAGREHLPPHGPYIIALNHLSYVDAPLTIAAMPWSICRQVFFLGTTEFFGGPVSSRIARSIQVIPVDMETKLYSALQLSAYVLRQGKALCIFPEGSRSRDGSLKEFKKGVGIIAKELNVPIVPAAITGAYEMLRPGARFPRPAKLRVVFGPPLHPDGKDYDGVVRELAGRVAGLLAGRQR